jgi:hypothetical protein
MVLKAVGIVILSGLSGYVLGAFLGVLMVEMFSRNGHDKSVESAMTGFAVVGPLAGLLSAVGGAAAYLR